MGVTQVAEFKYGYICDKLTRKIWCLNPAVTLTHSASLVSLCLLVAGMNRSFPVSPILTVRKRKADLWIKKKSYMMYMLTDNKFWEQHPTVLIKYQLLLLWVGGYQLSQYSPYFDGFWDDSPVYNIKSFEHWCFFLISGDLFVLFLAWILTERRHPRIAATGIWNNACVCVLIQKGRSARPCCPASKSKDTETLWSLKRRQWGRRKGPYCCPVTGKANKAHPLSDIRRSAWEREALQARLH